MRKKLYSILILTAMIATFIPCGVFAGADSAHIKTPSKISAGTTLNITVTSDDSEFEFQWLTSDSEDGEYTELLSDTLQTYVVTPRDKGKYIKAKIRNLVTDEVTLTDNAVHIENLGPVSRTSFNTENINSTMLTPKENIFSVGGLKFILLEEMNGSKSHYYVMTEELYGAKVFDSNNYAKFDPEREGNIGKFLNGEFLTSGGAGRVFPDGVKEHIDFDHIWYTEAGLSGGDCPEDYSFTAGISLLSQSEAVKYRSKYGWQPGGSDVITPWWGRTQRGVGGEADNILVMMGSNDSGYGNMWNKHCSQSYFVRPTFYLDEDFFGKVKCDVQSTGDAVKKIISEKYTIGELEELYSVEELVSLGFDIKSTVIAKEANPGGGDKLTAKMNDSEAVRFKYKWFISDTEEDRGKQVYGNLSDTYITGINDSGKYITAAVTPVYADGSTGEEVAAINKIYVGGFGAMARTNYPTDERRAYKNNPPEYLFTAGGEQMILLDAFDDEADNLFVMTADAKGQHVYDSDNTQKFDPEDINNVGYWLNNDFLTASTTISATVQKYINKEHLWKTEAGHAKGNCPEDYSFTAGVALLSRSEYSKYWGKFGWDNNESIQIAWWLRTGRNTSASDIFRVLGVKEGNYSTPEMNGYGNTWNKEASAAHHIRPVFYLNKDFLLNVKITEMGEKAAEVIRNILTPEEFEQSPAGYTRNELLKLGIIEQPEADNVMIDGKAGVGAEVKGLYSYIGEKTEGDTISGFEISDKEDGEFKKIADGTICGIAQAYEGKYIRFFVTPVNSENVKGKTYYSETVRVEKTVSISAEQLRITDKDGKVVSDLSGADKLNVSVKLINCTQESKKAWIMLFVYDANDDMLINRGVEVTLLPDSEKICESLSLSLPDYTEGNYAKLFIWDSLETMCSAQNRSVLIK